jgi:hypothetical protein
MKSTAEQKKLFKENLLNEIAFHRDKCTDNNCGVSLLVLYLLARSADIEFTEEEKRRFI